MLLPRLCLCPGGIPPCHVSLISSSIGKISTSKLSNFKEFSSDGKNIFFVFFDPGNKQSTPGWPFRNILVLLNVYLKLKEANVILFKFARGDYSGETGVRVMKIKLSDCMCG